MKDLIEKYETAQKVVSTIFSALRDKKDGFTYLLSISSYGANWITSYDNYYTATLAAQEYCGDNGFADIYTTNLDHKFDELRGGDVIQKSFDELVELSKGHEMHRLLTALTNE